MQQKNMNYSAGTIDTIAYNRHSTISTQQETNAISMTDLLIHVHDAVFDVICLRPMDDWSLAPVHFVTSSLPAWFASLEKRCFTSESTCCGYTES